MAASYLGSMAVEFSFRPASAGDRGELAATVGDGFASFAEFAPAGWTPPTVDAAELERGLRDERSWFLVAEGPRREMAGHVAFLPASRHRMPDPAPGLCHLTQLFVRRPHWGSGLAATLHDRALAEAERRGYTAMRLFTPSGQARARRFYEREGWSLAADRGLEPFLGLEIVEYRRRL
jgi:GNAT superfamily N-acetyltransferase